MCQTFKGRSAVAVADALPAATAGGAELQCAAVQMPYRGNEYYGESLDLPGLICCLPGMDGCWLWARPADPPLRTLHRLLLQPWRRCPRETGLTTRLRAGSGRWPPRPAPCPSTTPWPRAARRCVACRTCLLPAHELPACLYGGALAALRPHCQPSMPPTCPRVSSWTTCRAPPALRRAATGGCLRAWTSNCSCPGARLPPAVPSVCWPHGSVPGQSVRHPTMPRRGRHPHPPLPPPPFSRTHPPTHPHRFEVEYGANLNAALQALGIHRPFEGGDITQARPQPPRPRAGAAPRGLGALPWRRPPPCLSRCRPACGARPQIATDGQGHPVGDLVVSDVIHKVYCKVGGEL